MHPRDQLSRRPAELDERHPHRPTRTQTEQRHEISRKPVPRVKIEIVWRATDSDCRDHALACLDPRTTLRVVGQRLDESGLALAQKRDQRIALPIKALVVEAQQAIARGEGSSRSSPQRMILQRWCYASEVD